MNFFLEFVISSTFSSNFFLLIYFFVLFSVPGCELECRLYNVGPLSVVRIGTELC